LIGDTKLPDDVTIACIGPITAETAKEFGLKPDIVAEEHTIDGLVEGILKRGYRGLGAENADGGN
jgi:uroporphyrinogen III methyltransferase/synthase